MQRVQLFMRAAGLAAAFTVASAGLNAQTKAQQSPGTTKTAGNTATVSSDDTMFAKKAAQGGMKEVQIGKMVASKSSNASVKAYANRLVKDHSAANKDLMAIMKRKNISMPDDPHAGADRGSVGAHNDATTATKTAEGRPAGAAANPTGTTGASGGVHSTGAARAQMGMDQPWMTQTGSAFDKGFVDAQVEDHQKDIAEFEKEAQSGGDPELKAFAAKTLPTLREHLKQAQDLQTKLGATTR